MGHYCFFLGVFSMVQVQTQLLLLKFTNIDPLEYSSWFKFKPNFHYSNSQIYENRLLTTVRFLKKSFPFLQKKLIPQGFIRNAKA
jgi:hypothetical protein